MAEDPQGTPEEPLTDSELEDVVGGMGEGVGGVLGEAMLGEAI